MGRARFKVVARGRWSVLLLVLLGSGSGRRTASAQSSGPSPAWLREYRVAPGCPDAATFSARVAERQSSLGLSAPAPVNLRLSITQSAATAFSGTLDVADGSAVTRRTVAGKDCDEVVVALALIAAIALEPEGGDVRAAQPPDGAPAPSTATEPAASPAAPDTDEAARAPSSGVALGAYAFGMAYGAAAPEGALGAGLALALEWRTASVWQPALSLGVFRVVSDERSFAGGAARARFELSAAQGVLCPWRWPAHGRWGLRPCLEVELGWLEGSSSGPAVIDPTTRAGLWASAALAARADMNPWGPLRLSLLGSGVVPLTRHDFSFSPEDTLVFRVPGLSWQVAVLIGVVF
jgi:hypothetical protein